MGFLSARSNIAAAPPGHPYRFKMGNRKSQEQGSFLLLDGAFFLRDLLSLLLLRDNRKLSLPLYDKQQEVLRR